MASILTPELGRDPEDADFSLAPCPLPFLSCRDLLVDDVKLL